MWNKFVRWVDDLKNRNITIQSFNRKSKDDFIAKKTSLLLEAKTTIGCTEFKHSFSKFMASGFNIKAADSANLKPEQIQDLGKAIIMDETFVRKLISLGWDTLEVQDSEGKNCFKWQLNKHIGI